MLIHPNRLKNGPKGQKKNSFAMKTLPLLQHAQRYAAPMMKSNAEVCGAITKTQRSNSGRLPSSGRLNFQPKSFTNLIQIFFNVFIIHLHFNCFYFLWVFYIQNINKVKIINFYFFLVILSDFRIVSSDWYPMKKDWIKKIKKRLPVISTKSPRLFVVWKRCLKYQTLVIYLFII